jgi:hypothetical protein
MATGRARHTATALVDGRVLMTGGGSIGEAVDSAELYDPATGTFGPPAPAPPAGPTPFDDFLARETELTSPEIQAILVAVARAAQDHDDDRLRSDFARLEARATAEITWLAAHPPQPCYAALLAARRAEYEDLVKSGELGRAGDVPGASVHMDLANRRMIEINSAGMFPAARDRCALDPSEPG